MPTHESHLAALNCRKTIRAKHNNICMHDFSNMFSVSSSYPPAEQVLAILKCLVHFMNFASRPIITITMLSKILGAFNAAFSYTGISLRSLVKRVGIIYRHLAYSTHEPPLLMSVYACLSVQYVNPWVEGSRGGSALSVGVYASVFVINPYKRAALSPTLCCLIFFSFPFFFTSLNIPAVWRKKLQDVICHH